MCCLHRAAATNTAPAEGALLHAGARAVAACCAIARASNFPFCNDPAGRLRPPGGAFHLATCRSLRVRRRLGATPCLPRARTASAGALCRAPGPPLYYETLGHGELTLGTRKSGGGAPPGHPVPLPPPPAFPGSVPPRIPALPRALFAPLVYCTWHASIFSPATLR
ncbi:MAG: hypothetical protein J3K34DRAFT_399363 [Monoraphidium minutum]|nr:MAG: hypothetical protein J3K34DRAFT_399363 [Monoraphidium minutum]